MAPSNNNNFEIIKTYLKPYPPEIIELAKTDGFISAFYKACSIKETAIEAFEYINDIHEFYYGRPKYTDYHTFKNVRNRFNNRFLNKS